MNRKLFAFITALTLAAGCSSEQKRAAALDPSNPNAPESAALTVPELGSAATASEQAQGSSPAPNGAAAGVDTHDKKPVYTCPMHPEVTSDRPGNCPKCGMKLVPKSTTSAGGQAGVHEHEAREQ